DGWPLAIGFARKFYGRAFGRIDGRRPPLPPRIRTVPGRRNHGGGQPENFIARRWLSIKFFGHAWHNAICAAATIFPRFRNHTEIFGRAYRANCISHHRHFAHHLTAIQNFEFGFSACKYFGSASSPNRHAVWHAGSTAHHRPRPWLYCPTTFMVHVMDGVDCLKFSPQPTRYHYNFLGILC